MSMTTRCELAASTAAQHTQMPNSLQSNSCKRDGTRVHHVRPCRFNASPVSRVGAPLTVELGQSYGAVFQGTCWNNLGTHMTCAGAMYPSNHPYHTAPSIRAPKMQACGQVSQQADEPSEHVTTTTNPTHRATCGVVRSDTRSTCLSANRLHSRCACRCGSPCVASATASASWSRGWAAAAWAECGTDRAWQRPCHLLWAFSTWRVYVRTRTRARTMNLTRSLFHAETYIITHTLYDNSHICI